MRASVTRSDWMSKMAKDTNKAKRGMRPATLLNHLDTYITKYNLGDFSGPGGRLVSTASIEDLYSSIEAEILTEARNRG